MKKIKSFISIMLVAVMALAMSMTAFAAPENQNGPFTITIKGDGTNTQHTYDAYQIFSGTLATDVVNNVEKKYLSDITWGSGVNQTGLLDAVKAVNGFETCTSAADVAKVLATADNSTVQAFAKAINSHLATADGTATSAGNGTTITISAAGYYLIKDQADAEDQESFVNTDLILEVVGDVQVTPKSDVPTVEKKVKDINDSDGTESDYQDTADYDVNDHIPYQLTATLPENYDGYTKYEITFTDTMSKGLTFDNNVRVYAVNGKSQTEISHGTVATADYTGTDSAYEGGKVITIPVGDLKEIKAITGGDVSITKETRIVVEYTCTLNKDAVVVGNAGNKNKVSLQYSNNPNDTNSKGKTPEEEVIVFTYELDVDKVDENNAALAGAGFTLEKFVKGQGNQQDKWETISNIPAGTVTTFTFTGVDDGIYRLHEATTPAGYNSIEDIYFMVAAQHDGTTSSLKIFVPTDKNAEKTLPATYNKETNNGFSAEFTSGKISTKVENKQGSLLPSTGGIGTTIFYIVGAILVIGAGIILVTKKRMSHE